MEPHSRLILAGHSEDNGGDGLGGGPCNLCSVRQNGRFNNDIQISASTSLLQQESWISSTWWFDTVTFESWVFFPALMT